MVAIEGDMPDGVQRISFVSPLRRFQPSWPLKGYAIANRLKRKDAYGIYYSIRNFPDGIDALVKATRPVAPRRYNRPGKATA